MAACDTLAHSITGIFIWIRIGPTESLGRSPENDLIWEALSETDDESTSQNGFISDVISLIAEQMIESLTKVY